MRLHEFDLLLSSYLKGTIGGQIIGWQPNDPSPAVIMIQRPTTGRQPPPDRLAKYRRLSAPDLLGNWLRNTLDPSLWNHLITPTDPKRPLLLSRVDFDELATSLGDLEETGLGREPEWVAWHIPHQEYLKCLPELRELLAPAVAQRFSSLSERCIAQLKSKQIGLRQGIQTIDQWTSEIRLLLQAAGKVHLLPRPEGSFPTPRASLPEAFDGAGLHIIANNEIATTEIPTTSASTNKSGSVQDDQYDQTAAQMEVWPRDEGWYFRPGEFAFNKKIGKATGKVWKLLKLLSSRNRNCRREYLEKEIWDEIQDRNALDNLITRARRVLRETFGLGKGIDVISRTDRGPLVSWKIQEEHLKPATIEAEGSNCTDRSESRS